MATNISEDQYSHIVLKANREEFIDKYLMLVNITMASDKRLMPKEITLVREFILWQIENGFISIKEDWLAFRKSVLKKRFL